MENTSNRIERTFALAAGAVPQIVCRNPAGFVEVRGEARDDVAVVVTCDPPDALARGVEITVEQQGERVFVEAKWPSTLGWMRATRVRVTMQVRTPRRSDVEMDIASSDGRIEDIDGAIQVQSASGDLSVTNLAGSIHIQSASGDIRAAGLRGRAEIRTASGDVTVVRAADALTIRTANGDVQIDDIAGTLILHTASGDVHVQRSTLTACEMQTASGDLEIATSLAPAGSYEFQTVSGDIRLFVPQTTSAMLSWTTISGDLSSALPAERQGGKRNGTLIVNGGGVAVRVKTVSGDCDLRIANDLPALLASPTSPVDAATVATARPTQTSPFLVDNAPPAPREPEAEADTPPETLAILQSLERGELTIEEAMRQLAALEN